MVTQVRYNFSKTEGVAQKLAAEHYKNSTFNRKGAIAPMFYRPCYTMFIVPDTSYSLDILTKDSLLNVLNKHKYEVMKVSKLGIVKTVVTFAT